MAERRATWCPSSNGRAPLLERADEDSIASGTARSGKLLPRDETDTHRCRFVHPFAGSIPALLTMRR